MKAQPSSWVTFSEQPQVPVPVLGPALEPTNPIPVAFMEPLPSGCVTADKLFSLGRTLNRLEAWYKRHRTSEIPCLRLVQGARNGRITALVQVGEITLKLQLKGDEWIVLGDALKVSD